MNVPILDGISPRMERFCDIGHIFPPQDRDSLPNENLPLADPHTAIFSFDFETQPNNLAHCIAPGQYRLTLFIAASNNRPVQRVLDIELTGKWSDDMNEMLREGIRIRLLSPAEVTALGQNT